MNLYDVILEACYREMGINEDSQYYADPKDLATAIEGAIERNESR